MFKGSNTALLTPFRNGKLDEKAFQDLVEKQVRAGSHGLVPAGTTGEAPTLTMAEHKRIIELCVEASGKCPVLAGCGTNATEKTLALCRQAETAGADGLLVVTPYYNRPSQEGLFLHYQALAKATRLPIVIYNIPGRTAIDMSVETMARLYEAFDNIIGVKDATGGLERVVEQKRMLGDDFLQLCGEDILAFEFNKRGGLGAISVTSNVAPKLCAEFQELCQAGDFEKAEKVHEKLSHLHRGLFVETNPVPVKYAASLMGLCKPDVRLPLAPLSDVSKKSVKMALKASGVKS